MPILPIVVYVEDKHGRFQLSGGNRGQEALVYHLKTACECEVYDYDNQHELLDDLERIRWAIEAKRLLAVIADEDQHDPDQHLSVIRTIRGLSQSVPIVVFPEKWTEGATGVEGYRRIYTKYHNTSRRLSNLIRRWRKDMKLPLDHFGTESPAETRRVVGQLQHVYQRHYLDGNELGTPDHNGQTVAQAMRIRLCPAWLFREEFDEALREEPSLLVDHGKEAYEHQMQVMRVMCEADGDPLWRLLYDSRGDTTGGSSGNKVEGFAIDPVTLEYFRTGGYGAHRCAAMNLEHRLSWIADLEGVNRRSMKKANAIENRIVTGELFQEVPGFTFPVIQFSAYSLRDGVGQRIAQFLKNSRLGLPLAMDDQENDFKYCAVEC